MRRCAKLATAVCSAPSASRYFPLLLPALLLPQGRAFPTAAGPTPASPATASAAAARRGFCMSASAGTGAAGERVKVLALHGYGQTADTFSQKMGAVRKECKSDVDWVFLDAPYIVRHADFDMTGPSWYDFSKLCPDTGDMTWGGFDDTLKLFEKTWVEQGPFDGIVGFSQGAAVVFVLAAMQDRGELPPVISPFRFACMISGFLPQDPSWGAMCEERKILKVRSMHVIGEADDVVVPARSQRAAECFGGGVTVVKHAKGHLVPSYKGVRARMRSFMVGDDGVKDEGQFETVFVTPGKDPPVADQKWD